LINDGTAISGEPHEVAGYPIGAAIESYQGALTVEVFLNDATLYSERLCETLKMVAYHTVVGRLDHLVFRLRSAWESTSYVDADQYVVVAGHSTCGTEGAS